MNVSPYLSIDEKERTVRYLGYIMPLTSGEFEVLRAVALAKAELDKKGIVKAVCDDVKLSELSVAAHICSINKKARELGGKNLVAMRRKKGYFMENGL